jgi:hypothetical protein
MAKRSWLKVISRLKKLIDEVGPLWPESTDLAGYGEQGPYHCGDCVFLRGMKSGDVFKDDQGKGRCSHPVMIADIKVLKDNKGIPIVDIKHGCCEFVEYEKNYVEESDDKD